MKDEMIQVGNCPTCDAFPVQHIAADGATAYRFVKSHDDTTLADTQRAIIEAAERRGYERAKAEHGGGGEATYGVIDPDYARVFTIARCIAWSEGYMLAMHGSFTRDLDLIAVPWTDHACEPGHLMRRIEDAAGLNNVTDEPGQKPHGRLVWTLMFPGFSDPRFVDLGIMPPPQPRAEGMVLVPQQFVDKVQAAARAVHPTATAVLVDEAVDLLAAAPGEGGGDGWCTCKAGAYEMVPGCKHCTPPSASQSVTPSDEAYTQREITQALAAHYRNTTGDERHMAAAIMAAETAAAIVKSIREQRAAMAAIREVQP